VGSSWMELPMAVVSMGGMRGGFSIGGLDLKACIPVRFLFVLWPHSTLTRSGR
jgi:hypothetical protein